MSLLTDTPIALSILKPGWVYGGDRISSSAVGLLCHLLFDYNCKHKVGAKIIQSLFLLYSRCLSMIIIDS